MAALRKRRNQLAVAAAGDFKGDTSIMVERVEPGSDGIGDLPEPA